MKYLFDTNIFIRSKNEMPVDVWPTFWKRIAEMIHSGQVFISVKVKEEIERGKDELTDWIKTTVPKSGYIPVDKEILEKFAETQIWAATQPCNEDAKLEFAEVADAYLVATAVAKNMILVTYEKSNPRCKRRIMIPDACRAIGAKFCDLNTALREMKIQI